jgi:hypothetical protein
MLLIRQRLGKAAGGDQHRQRHDERDQPPVRDQDPVDQAGAHPDEQRAQHHHDRSVALGRERRRPDRRQRDQRAHREIDAAADDDERHADRDHADDRGADQDVQNVRRREKPAVGGHHADDPENDENADEAELTHPGQPAGQPRRPSARAGDRGSLLDPAVLIDRRNVDAGCSVASLGALAHAVPSLGMRSWPSLRSVRSLMRPSLP